MIIKQMHRINNSKIKAKSREVTATIQARMGSSRLPGKVLSEICGKPMLEWQVLRLSQSRLIDNIIIGTTTDSKDDLIEDFCEQRGIDCFRGSESDVLSRIAKLLEQYKVDIHLECYGDSPLIDPQIADEFIGMFLKRNDEKAYFSSALKTTYPPGQEITLYKANILLEVDRLIKQDDKLREHVGYNITRFPESYNLYSIEAPSWLSEPEIYLEVDTDKDLELVKEIFKYFINRGQSHFSLTEILSMLKANNELIHINNNVPRRWKELRGD